MKLRHYIIFFVILYPQAFLAEIYFLDNGTKGLMANIIRSLIFTGITMFTLSLYVNKYGISKTDKLN